MQQHGIGRTTAFRVVLLILVGVAFYLAFELGRINAGYDIVDVAAEREGYESYIRGLESQLADLKQEVALLETHREVDREAYREVEQSLVTLQAKIQEQQDAIGFYRGIVSPADGKAGLRVQDLKLTRGDAEREFKLRLVLVQAKKHDRKVSGDVELTVNGHVDGRETSFRLADLVDKDDADWKFSFRYFQNFDRRLVLPDGFQPETITVAVQSRTRSIASIEESFAWATSSG